MSRREWRPILAFILLGWRQAAAQRATTVGRILLLWLILFIFWAMWQATPLGELGTGSLTVEQLFWYLAATETVAMSVGFPYRSVEADIVSGEIANSLVRPIDYGVAALASWIGETTHRFIAVLVAALTCALLTTRTLPLGVSGTLLLILGLWLGCLMVLLCQLGIGLLAIWMRSAAPAFWIWQKLFFVLGGLMIPLSLYPHWLATAAKATPFAAMLFLPASLIFEQSAAQTIELFLLQAGWLAVLAALVWWLLRRVQLHVRLHGA